MIRVSPSTKALLVTVVFSLLALFSLWWMPAPRQYVLPLLLSYVVLLANTYLSIRCFAAITPPGYKLQDAIDILLIAFYIGIAFTFTNPLWLFLFMTFLFIIASMKYALLLDVVHYTRLLKRKIIIDIIGIFGSGLALTLWLFGYLMTALWLWAVGFTLVSFYIFFVNPLYKVRN